MQQAPRAAVCSVAIMAILSTWPWVCPALVAIFLGHGPMLSWNCSTCPSQSYSSKADARARIAPHPGIESFSPVFDISPGASRMDQGFDPGIVMLSSAVPCLRVLLPCFVAPYAGKVAACSGRISTRAWRLSLLRHDPAADLRLGARRFVPGHRVPVSSSCNLGLCYLALAHCRGYVKRLPPRTPLPVANSEGRDETHSPTWRHGTQLDCIPPRSTHLGAGGLTHPCRNHGHPAMPPVRIAPTWLSLTHGTKN